MNFVPFNANLIIDYKAKDLSEPYVYPPHMPLEILQNQSMMNMSTKNSTELKKLFDELDQEIDGQKSNLELIMDTYNSNLKKHAFERAGYIMDKKQLYFSMDFNFMNVLLHTLENDASLSAQYIFEHVDSQPFSDRNYFLIMLGFEKIIEREMGGLLTMFLNDDMSSTTMRIMVEDQRLDPN